MASTGEQKELILGEEALPSHHGGQLRLQNLMGHLALVFQVFLPEDRHLSLDERYCRARAVRETNRAKEIGVAIKEIGVVQ